MTTKKTFNLLCLPAVESIGEVVDKFPSFVKLTKGDYEKLEFIFWDQKFKILTQDIDLNSFSFVWLSSSWENRDLAYAVSLYLKEFNVPLTYVEKSTSKLTDQMVFALNKIPIPDTFFISDRKIKNSLSKIKEVCGYPLITKDIKGYGGACSEYVKNEKDLLEKVKKLPESKRYFFQKFIPNDYDWGVLVVNGEVVSGEKSYPIKGEFRNNACKGAKEVFVEVSKIPLEVRKIALKATGLLDLEWARADIIIDKITGKPYLLEINRYPGVTSKSQEVDGAYKFLSSHFRALPGEFQK